MVGKSTIFASTSLISLKCSFLETKDTVFRTFQRSHVIAGLNVKGSIGIGGKLGGWGWLRLNSDLDVKLFSSRTQFELRLPKLDSKIFNMYYSFVLTITISLHDCFCCARNEREISSLKSHDGLETATFLYQRCLLQYVWKEELWKLLSRLYSHRDKESDMIKEAAGYGEQGEKGGKISFFFLNTSLLQV